MNNTSNVLGFVFSALAGIVVATAITLLFAFGFLPFLATSVIYINVTSILVLTLTLIFAFILYLKKGCTPTAIADDLRALSILSVISLIAGIITTGLVLTEPTTAGIVLVAILTLAFAVTLFVAVKLVFDFLTRECNSCNSCNNCDNSNNSNNNNCSNSDNCGNCNNNNDNNCNNNHNNTNHNCNSCRY